VEVDRERLQASEPRVTLVEMAPTGLGETDARILENTERSAQEVARWNEVGVENRNERRIRQCQAMRQRAGLEALASAAQHVRHADPALPPKGDTAGDDGDGLVVRIVEGPHLESTARPLQLANRVEHALGHVSLVVDGHLDADSRLTSGSGRFIPARTQARRAPGQIQEVRTKSEQRNAGGRDDANRDRGDHSAAPSNSV